MSTTTILAWVGNILNFTYNVPQVIVVLKHKSARNISKWFLILRSLTCITWIAYSELEKDSFITSCYTVTLISSLVMLAVKLRENNQPEPENSTSDG